MDKVKYYIKWDGKDKRGIVKGEIEIPEKIGENILTFAVMKKVGDSVLEACKDEPKKKVKTNSRKRNK